jgi:hypothetical protein
VFCCYRYANFAGGVLPNRAALGADWVASLAVSSRRRNFCFLNLLNLALSPFCDDICPVAWRMEEQSRIIFGTLSHEQIGRTRAQAADVAARRSEHRRSAGECHRYSMRSLRHATSSAAPSTTTRRFTSFLWRFGRDMGTHVEVLSSIQASDTLVASPSDLLDDGRLVSTVISKSVPSHKK